MTVAYDVFNGDADGICALHQLRLLHPRDSVLVTGVKREIDLLRRVPQGMHTLTVLDVSFDANRDAIRALLDSGATIDFTDHHAATERFDHPGLIFHWDDSPDVCTSLLVSQRIDHQHLDWAIAAAYGDNLDTVAHRLAAHHGMSAQQRTQLAELGTLLNYNAYGETVDDLHYPPEQLFRAVHAYRVAQEFIDCAPEFIALREGFRSDTAHAAQLQPHASRAQGAVYLLPDAPWARRMSGIVANRVASAGAGQAFAVAVPRSDGRLTISVRSAQPDRAPAYRFCEHYGGGGRRLAAGINDLEPSQWTSFVSAFFDYFR